MKNLHTEKKALLHRFSTNKLYAGEVDQIKHLLKQFVQGSLNEVDSKEIIEVLVNNKHCMATLEQLWPHSPFLENATAQRLEYKIKREIQRLSRLKMKSTPKISEASKLQQRMRRRHSHMN